MTQPSAGAIIVSRSTSGLTLAQSLRRLGLECTVSRSVDALAGSTGQRPVVLVEAEADTADLSAVKDAVGMGFNTLVIGDGNSIEQRLASVRAGAAGFIPKPLEPMSVADFIERLADPAADEPFRVLVVDDSPAMAAATAAVLEKAGMQVAEETDPVAVLEVIRANAPDLVLLDIHMPVCSGIELAAVIRQHQELVGLPIVFLSAETEVSRQLLAMSRGGDDFLVKPVPAQTLISAVTARIARARALKAALLTDGLTGLLNRKAFIQHLEPFLVQANRAGWDVPVFMVDVDHFKKINDTYGHPVGDQVLRHLAALLRRRLRRSDVVGRLGGEEFAIALPRTSPEQAMQLMDRLREEFSAIEFDSGETQFHATFSGGMATVGRNVAEFMKAADVALYAAKRDGRNRLVSAGS